MISFDHGHLFGHTSDWFIDEHVTQCCLMKNKGCWEAPGKSFFSLKKRQRGKYVLLVTLELRCHPATIRENQAMDYEAELTLELPCLGTSCCENKYSLLCKLTWVFCFLRPVESKMICTPIWPLPGHFRSLCSR